MRLVSIAPMFIEHKTPVCLDLAELERNGSITETAFMMKLNPEGTPPADAVTPAGQRFTEMRDELRKYSSMPVGILIQATIGHGYWRDTPPDNFQRMVTLAPENPEGLRHIVCPLDPGFRKYFQEVARKLSALNPDFLMIDDDYRIFTGRFGCLCPLHIAEYNRLRKTRYTRETLSEVIRKDRETALDYEGFLGVTFAEVLSDFRAALNEQTPDMNVYYCSCTKDVKVAADFAERLAANGGKPVIRLNNGRYSRETMRDFPLKMYTSAAMIAYLGGTDRFELLSEADTCPHNQYATSAALLNCHMAGSIAEGCSGAKHWLTTLTAHEPESGLAYRRILAEYRGFYRELAELRSQKSDLGITIPVPGKLFREHSVFQNETIDAQAEFIVALTRLGVPANYGIAAKTPVVINREFADSWSDDEIRVMLSHGAILEGSMALLLAKRGFSELMGVEVTPFPAIKATVEKLNDGRNLRPQAGSELVFLKSLSDKTEVLSVLYVEGLNGVERGTKAVAPGMTFFRNAGGGYVLVFAGSPVRHVHWPDSTAFLTLTRKEILLKQLKIMADLPAIYAGPDDIYSKLWRCGDEVVMPLITLGRDDIPELELDVKCHPVKVEFLLPSGTWKKIPFREKGDRRIILEQEFRATRPFVLKFFFPEVRK